MSTFDFTGAEAWEESGEQYLGVGTHAVTIESADPGWTKGEEGAFGRQRKPQIELKVANVNGSRRDWIVITPKTVGKVAQLYDAAHVERPKEGEFNPETGELTEECIARLRGQRVGVVIRMAHPFGDVTRPEQPEISGYIEVQRVTDDAPADTRGLPSVEAPSASRPANEKGTKIPF